MVVLLICLLLSALLAIAASIAIFNLPFSNRAVNTKRGLLFLVWVSATLAMLGFFGFAFIGFLGHNSAPTPKATFQFNLPLYGAFILYSIAGLALISRARWARKRQNSIAVR